MLGTQQSFHYPGSSLLLAKWVMLATTRPGLLVIQYHATVNKWLPSAPLNWILGSLIIILLWYILILASLLLPESDSKAHHC